MRCKRTVPAKTKSGYDTFKCCANKARKFYRVQYESLSRYYRSMNLANGEVFGFCEDCDKKLSPMNPSSWVSGWNREGTVYHLRGTVKSVVQSVEAEATSSKEEKFRDAVKMKFKTCFSQKWTSKLTYEQWSQLFSEALDEYQIETVMDT